MLRKEGKFSSKIKQNGKLKYFIYLKIQLVYRIRVVPHIRCTLQRPVAINQGANKKKKKDCISLYSYNVVFNIPKYWPQRITKEKTN